MNEKLEQIKNYLKDEEFSKREYCLLFCTAFLSGLALGMLLAPKNKVENNTYKCYYEEEE